MPAVSLNATAERGGQNRSVVVLCDDQTELSLAWAWPSQLSGILSIIRAAANSLSVTNY